ncbi:MAG: metallophosphoesterase family protein [Xanthobacteraceae bacterium]
MPLTYAIGDIHGSLDKLRRLIAACREHAHGGPLNFVFLGDYIDRGSDSAGVLHLMLSLQVEFKERLIALKGNHEAWLLAVFDRDSPTMGWIRNGGAATLASYAVKDVGELPRAHLDWMRKLRLTYDDGRRLFVHAGVNPERALDAQDESELLWIREPFLSDGRGYGRLIVHGHTPLEEAVPDLRANRLNLDTGAVFGGPLTAAVFDDDQTEPLTFVQAF